MYLRLWMDREVFRCTFPLRNWYELKIWIIAFILTTCSQELCRTGMEVKRPLPPPVMDKNEKLGMWLSASGALSHPGIFMNERAWDKLSIPVGVGKNFAVGNCTASLKNEPIGITVYEPQTLDGQGSLQVHFPTPELIRVEDRDNSFHSNHLRSR